MGCRRPGVCVESGDPQAVESHAGGFEGTEKLYDTGLSLRLVNRVIREGTETTACLRKCHCRPDDVEPGQIIQQVAPAVEQLEFITGKLSRVGPVKISKQAINLFCPGRGTGFLGIARLERSQVLDSFQPHQRVCFCSLIPEQSTDGGRRPWPIRQSAQRQLEFASTGRNLSGNKLCAQQYAYIGKRQAAIYPLQQEQSNRYRRVFRQSPAVRRVHGGSQFCAAVLPAGSDTLPYQSFARCAVSVQRRRNDADGRARLLCQLAPRPGAGRTEFCLRVVEFHDCDLCDSLSRSCYRNLAADVLHCREQISDIRRQPVKACMDDSIGRWRHPFFE